MIFDASGNTANFGVTADDKVQIQFWDENGDLQLQNATSSGSVTNGAQGSMGYNLATSSKYFEFPAKFLRLRIENDVAYPETTTRSGGSVVVNTNHLLFDFSNSAQNDFEGNVIRK